MARSYDELSVMAARFGLRLAKARRGSQHLGVPVRYLLEDKTNAAQRQPMIQFSSLMSCKSPIQGTP
jgi:hypothetical protein